MLNIGQVVYDYTNERVLIFAGTQPYQNQKTSECHIEFGFVLKDGTFIHVGKDEEIPFKYTNLNMGGKPLFGSFVGRFKLNGHYFGIIKGDGEGVKEAAKAAIEEVEALIVEYGLRTIEMGQGDRKYTSYYIDVFE